jgi:hypothetical protein
MDEGREQIISRARLGGEAETTAIALRQLQGGAAVYLRDSEDFKHRLLRELVEMGDRADQIATDLIYLSRGIEEPAAKHRLANRGANPAVTADAAQLAAIEGRG